MQEDYIHHSPLGKHTNYVDTYTPSLLFPIPRCLKREELGISEPLPFQGYDIWNAYEISWLNLQGKPQIAFGEILVPCDSENIIESKSLKLYFNSFNQTKFDNMAIIRETIEKDISSLVGDDVSVKLFNPQYDESTGVHKPTAICLDELDVIIDTYQPDPKLLHVDTEYVEETLMSDLLKSNCPVTGQPDWATVLIHYVGHRINHASLLRYIISYREHHEFHEQCVERMFMNIMSQCQPEKLTVFARYTRRGGIDINPFRSNFENHVKNERLVRQ